MLNNDTFILLIIFENGEHVTISGVDDYGVCANNELFYYYKNGWKSFMPVKSVQFIGRADCYSYDYKEG